MRLPVVRFTVGRMMVAVAFAGVPAWGIRLVQLAEHYRALARKNDGYRIGCGLLCCIPDHTLPPAEQEKERRDFKIWVTRRRGHFEALKAECEQAARNPWWPVAPDRPPPR